ncbi:MAG: hypothetical protein JXR56_03350 [Candidatus Cloacimonetes bacterium]|nr:hypothetical protein [Candidatus Cloacimonadota bacterium]
MKKVAIVLLSIMILGCAIPSLSNLKNASEVKTKAILLPEPFSSKYAEYSAMCPLMDGILLVPQYPERFKTDTTEGSFLFLKNTVLKNYIEGDSTSSIACNTIEVKGLDELHKLEFYEGFEACASDDAKLYFAIEIGGEKPYTIAVKGDFNAVDNTINLDSSSITKLETPIILENATYESIALFKQRLYFFYEGNGKAINPDAYALSTDKDFRNAEKIPFPNLEFRVTDATSISDKGSFYVINYFWPGDAEKYKPQTDMVTLIEVPATGIERLIPLKIFNGRIEPDLKAKVINLEYNDRNWEGIVRFEDGFLLVTDKYPETELLYTVGK